MQNTVLKCELSILGVSYPSSADKIVNMLLFCYVSSINIKNLNGKP